MQKWEYLRILLWRDKPRFSLDFTDWKFTTPEGRDVDFKVFWDYVSALGAEGWELVSVVPFSWLTGREFAGTTSGLYFFFKRPLKEQ